MAFWKITDYMRLGSLPASSVDVIAISLIISITLLISAHFALTLHNSEAERSAVAVKNKTPISSSTTTTMTTMATGRTTTASASDIEGDRGVVVGEGGKGQKVKEIQKHDKDDSNNNDDGNVKDAIESGVGSSSSGMQKPPNFMHEPAASAVNHPVGSNSVSETNSARCIVARFIRLLAVFDQAAFSLPFLITVNW
jgi:hypothetical protein